MLNRLTSKQLENIFALLSALIGFIAYWMTLCPTVNFIDSGELSTVCYTLGIAHPTGYPIFTILGYAFSHLPLGLRTIYQLNLFSAVNCAVGLFVFFKLVHFIANEYLLKSRTNTRNNSEYSWLTFVPAICATLALAFSETYWSQALSIEVYSLQMVFLTTIIFFFTKAIKSESDYLEGKIATGTSRYWYLFAYVLGLSFTNHLTTGFLAPAFLTAYFYTCKFSAVSFKRILHMAVPFAIGLSAYLYLPMRAVNQPMMNWGNPSDFEKLQWHFSGKVYHVWFLESKEAILKQFSLFIQTLPAEFAYIGLAIALIGFIKLFKESKTAGIFTLLLFVSSAIFASFYDIHDIETYFLLAYITTAIWIGFGIKFFIDLKPEITTKRLIALISVVSVLLIGAVNYSKVDESKTTMVESYTKDMLQSVKPNAIIISFQWDYFVSAAYYLQLIEGVRPDVTIIDKELLRRTWYYPQLKNHFPELIEKSQNEMREFMKELDKFEHDIPYNPSTIEFRYTAMIHSFIEKNWDTRPVYVTPEIEQQYISNYKKIPSGLALQLLPQTDTTMHNVDFPDFNLLIPERMDKYRSGILSMYYQAYMNNAMYFQYQNKVMQANVLAEKARTLQQYTVPLE